MHEEEPGEEIDVEQYAREGKPVPHARRYRIRIDREHYVVSVAQLTGQAILALAGKTTQQYLLSQRLRGGLVEPVSPDQLVSFVEPGVERFMSMPKDTTEG